MRQASPRSYQLAESRPQKRHAHQLIRLVHRQSVECGQGSPIADLLLAQQSQCLPYGLYRLIHPKIAEFT